MLTELGKELRKLRIDRGERLLDMAQRLQKSSSFISAVEIGKKAPPAGFEDLVASAYQLTGDLLDRLRRAADRSRVAFTMEPETLAGRDTAGLFARRINSLSPDQLDAINDILSKKEGGE